MAHETIKTLNQGTYVLIGTIVNIEGDTPTIGCCHVRLDKYPLPGEEVKNISVFYHCAGSETISMGSHPFVEGDRVLIVNQRNTISAEDMKIVGYEDGLPRFCGWRFKLYRDDDTTVRYLADEGEHKKGDIKEASGTLMDPVALGFINIMAGGERVSLHEGNYVVKNEDDTYTLKNKKREDFVFGDYWTFSEGIWNYDDTGGYPYNPNIGSFNPSTGQYIFLWDRWVTYVGGLPGKNGLSEEYWILNEDSGIWYYDDSEDFPDNPSTGSYNPNTGYYTVDQKRNPGTAKVIPPAVTAPPDTKFWVEYNCNEHFLPANYYHTEDGQWRLGRYTKCQIQYPYKYKRADDYEIINKISMGTYEGNVPYWELTDQKFSPEPIEKPWNWYPSNACEECTSFTYAPGTYGGTVWFKSPFAIQRILKTSIPYKTQYTFDGGDGGVRWKGMGVYESCSGTTCGDVPCCVDVGCEGAAQKNSIMYYTEDGLVSLSFQNCYNDLPRIKRFLSDLIDRPDSIETEVDTVLNIKTKQSGFRYGCTYKYYPPEGGHWYWESRHVPTALDTVRIGSITWTVEIKIFYE